MNRWRIRRAGLFAVASAIVLAACSAGPGNSPGATDFDESIIYFGSGATQAEVYLLPMLMAGRDNLEEQCITVEYAAQSGDEVVSG